MLEYHTKISAWREQLDIIDAKLLQLLADRFVITRQVGAYKASHNLSPRDRGREAQQLTKIAQKARDLGINPELAQTILRTIIDEAAKEHLTFRKDGHAR